MQRDLTVMVKEPTEQKYHTSLFMVTINPNKRFDNINSAEAKQMMAKLDSLGNYLLKKKSIRSSLYFEDRIDKKTGVLTKLDRAAHIDRILEISEDRTGRPEWGSRDKKLHIHIEFAIKHRTYLKLNREYYTKVSEAFLGIPAKSIHVHISGATKNEGYKKYVVKGDKEDAKHFMDGAANSFHFDSTD
jgi:hypothetical protein